MKPFSGYGSVHGFPMGLMLLESGDLVLVNVYLLEWEKKMSQCVVERQGKAARKIDKT